MTASDTQEVPKCRCGLPMLLMEGGARMCENCDTVQPQQRVGLGRNKTLQDIRFDMFWLRETNQEYDPLPPGEDGQWEVPGFTTYPDEDSD